MPLTEDELFKRFSRIRTWNQGGARAPHKPLVLIWALCKLLKGEVCFSFALAEAEVGILLKKFGPPRHTSISYPFWRLQNDNIWNVQGIGAIIPNSSGDASPVDLRKNHAQATFLPDIETMLCAKPYLIKYLIYQLLDTNFPESLHADILQQAGIEEQDIIGTDTVHEPTFVTRTIRSVKRDPSFRRRILSLYENKCAVCGFHLLINNEPVAIEAAHIRWHQLGGNSHESNGLTLCSIHHKLFDRGAFSLDNEYKIRISKKHSLTGNHFDQYLGQYNDRSLVFPRSLVHMYSSCLPDQQNMQWHMREVYAG